MRLFLPNLILDFSAYNFSLFEDKTLYVSKKPERFSNEI